MTEQTPTPSPMPGWLRPAWVQVDLDAIRQNISHLRSLVAPAAICAVVKADAYGHGAIQVAHASLQAGATHLGVALSEEGEHLREAGIEAPILVLSQPPPEAMRRVVASRLTPTVYTRSGIEALLDCLKNEPSALKTGPFPVHLKVDTGMHRVGATPDEAVHLAGFVTSQPQLELQGLFTHLAVADEPGRPETNEQLNILADVVDRLAGDSIKPSVVHAANSAAAFMHSGARLDLVRPGIAVYGISPNPQLSSEPLSALRPALSLHARVSFVKTLGADEGVSYGLRYRTTRPTVIATVPLGYADGLSRNLSEHGGEVLIGGKRLPLVGAVTMDQALVDCGPDAKVHVGDEVVLIGKQGSEEITAWEWAQRLQTIAYEVTCGLSSRLPRFYT